MTPSTAPSAASLWHLAWRQLARDFRAGELRLLVVAVTLAVAALTAVGFFADRLNNGLARDARQLLGGDAIIASDQPAPPAFAAKAREMGLVVATSATFPSIGRAPDDKGGANMIKRRMSNDVLERVQQLVPLAEEAGLSMAQLAVAWALQNDNVSSAIIGASRPEQVHDNAAASGVKLDADLLTKIDDLLDPVVERDPARTSHSSPKTREA